MLGIEAVVDLNGGQPQNWLANMKTAFLWIRPDHYKYVIASGLGQGLCPEGQALGLGS